MPIPRHIVCTTSCTWLHPCLVAWHGATPFQVLANKPFLAMIELPSIPYVFKQVLCATPFQVRMFARTVAFHMHIIIVIMSSRSVQNTIAFNVRALLWAFKHSFVFHIAYIRGLSSTSFDLLSTCICNRLLIESRPEYYSHIYALIKIDIHTCRGITFDLIIKQGCLYSWYCLVSDSMSNLSMGC